MKEKFNSIPKPLKKHILLHFGFGVLSLLAAIVVLIIAKDFILSLPGWILLVYMAISGGTMLYNTLKGNFVVVTGPCISVDRTRFLKRVKAIHIQTERGPMRVPIHKQINKLNEGDAITIYMPSKTRIYEQDEGLVAFGYYAIDINRQ